MSSGAWFSAAIRSYSQCENEIRGGQIKFCYDRAAHDKPRIASGTATYYFIPNNGDCPDFPAGIFSSRYDGEKYVTITVEDPMTSIIVDDDTRAALEARAKGRGMTLPEYLRAVAEVDALPPKSNDDAHQQELHRRMQESIAEAGAVQLEPNRPQGKSGEFADAMFAKYRR